MTEQSPVDQEPHKREEPTNQMFDIHGLKSLESETSNLIRRGLMQLPITTDYKELLNLMKSTPKLSPWWAQIQRGSSASSQADFLIGDLWEKRLIEEKGGENPLIVLLAKLKQQYANDPVISENQVVKKLFERVPEVWWQEEG